MSTLISRNPATGEVIQEIPLTPFNELPKIFDQAAQAQIHWQTLSVHKRSNYLIQLREVLLNQVDELVELISNENGKPRYEAMVNEVFPSLDILTYFAKRTPHLLKDKTLSLTLMKHRKSYLNYWPIGIVAVISPWNYPFLLPFAEISMALASGNAVIFKPSEITPSVGLKIQELCNEAGLPPFVLQTVIGDGSLGAAVIQQKPGKIFFTGSVATGKKIMAAAAQHLIPLNLELGGKDAMIVLPDANLDYATSAALWGAFSNSGQVCASTERLLLHERIAEPFLNEYKRKISLLRQGPSSALDNDLGTITFENQKLVYEQQFQQARAKNIEFVTGGEFTADRKFLKPTVVRGPEIEKLDIYNEETFGPVVAVTTFKTVSEAIEKTNRSKYGLVASVITQNIALGEEIAKRLQVGTVNINETVYTCGLGETPWGGLKESGFGRSHSDIGIYEFVNIRHIHKPKARIFIFKSFWWFPYTPFQYRAFRCLLEIYRNNWLDKLKALPHFLWNFIQFLKKEKRL